MIHNKRYNRDNILLQILCLGVGCWLFAIIAPSARAWTTTVHNNHGFRPFPSIPELRQTENRVSVFHGSSSSASHIQLHWKPLFSSSSSLEEITSVPSVGIGSSIANDDETKHRQQHSSDPVPRTMEQALRTFFWGSFHGPQIVVGLLTLLSLARCVWFGPVGMWDVLAGLGAMIFWFFQEHVLHRHVLHSQHFRWYGTTIHGQHHQKPYFHISIDPAPLMVTWLVLVTVLCVWVEPHSWGISTSIGYGLAGLWYEWCHFLAHTRVQFRSNSWLARYFRTVQIHHARHHRIDDAAWLAFSIPSIDRVFGTLPDIQRRRTNRGK
jgi:hypothetical protein